MKKVKMNKIFEQAKDLHVRNIVVYGNSEDNALYIDAEFTTQVKQVELEDAFMKGALLINDGTNILVPFALTDNMVTTIGDSTNTVWEALATPAV